MTISHNYATILADIASASEALALCAGLAKDAALMTDAHEAVRQRGREAIRRLGEAAIGVAPITG